MAATAWAGPPAHAQSYDPDSPAGKEYEIPLSSVRDQHSDGADDDATAPEGSTSETTAPETTLFGEGIEPENTTDDSRDDPDPSPGGKGGEPGASGAGSQGGSSEPSGTERAITATIRSSPVAVPQGSSLGLGAGVALLVVFAAGGLALALRRRTAG